MLRLLVTLITVAIIALSMLATARAQHGSHGVGHDTWHEQFYNGLTRNGNSCCNMNDCRPTSVRTSSGFYEVEVDGEWARVPPETILRRAAPDGGAHVCAPKPIRPHQAPIYCVVLPPEI